MQWNTYIRVYVYLISQIMCTMLTYVQACVRVCIDIIHNCVFFKYIILRLRDTVYSNAIILKACILTPRNRNAQLHSYNGMLLQFICESYV